MSIISRLKVWIGSDTSAFEKGVDRSKRKMSTLGRAAKKLGGIMAGAFAADRLKSFALESIQLAKVQADAEKKLTAVLQATGHAAGLSAKELKHYASELQDITLYGDEATIAAMGMMASFKSIKGDVFKAAIRSAQDMSTVMDTDLKQSILQVGKALESPEIGMSALRKTGVSFTQEQIAAVKKLIAEGKKEEAQLIILKELQGEFGGAAKVAAEDAHGAMVQLFNAWGDLREVIGQSITPSRESLSMMTGYVKSLTNVVQTETIPVWKKLFSLMNPTYFLGNLQQANRAAAQEAENEQVIQGLKLRERDLSSLMELYSLYRKYNEEKQGWYQQSLSAIVEELRLRTSGVAAIDAAAEAQKRADEERNQAEAARKAGIAEVLQMDERTLSALSAKVKAIEGLRDAIEVTDQASLDYYNRENLRLQSISQQIEQLSQQRILAAQKSLDGGPLQTLDIYGGLQGAVQDIGLHTLTEDLTVLPGQIDIATGKLQELGESFIDLSPILKSGCASLASGIGEMLGSLATGGNLLTGFAKAVGGTFSDMAIQVGKIAISTGIAILGIKAALRTLNPFAAIAAGVALVALGTAVKGALSNLSGGGGTMASAGANSGNTVNIGNTRDMSMQMESRKMQIEVTGELKARGSSLVAVIGAENNRKNLTT